MTSTSAQKRATVMLVEDHVDSRQMYAEYLRAEFTVIEAGDGVGALEMMRAARPNIVVTDLSLPRMDGFELIERMRADTALQDIPVIALSGYSSVEHEARARKAGSDLVLLKPCLPEELARAVASAANCRKDAE